MTREEKFIERITAAFQNIAGIQKTPYEETPTTKKIVTELANALGKTYNSGYINVSTTGAHYITHNLGFEPLTTLLVSNCNGSITNISDKVIEVTISSYDTNAKIKIIAG